MTDFEISKQFDLDVSHDTKEDRWYSHKYCSPEMADDKIRGDASDVFSLGCVFLEMATLLLGKTLKNLGQHYKIIDEDPDTVDPQSACYQNLDVVYL